MKRSFDCPLAAVALLIGFSSCESQPGTASTDRASAPSGAEASTQESRNKEIIRSLMRTYENGDTAALNSVVSADLKDHTAMDPSRQGVQGRAEMKKDMATFRTGFRDAKLSVNHLIAEGDKVVVHSTTKATNTGPIMGMPATNKKISVDAVDVFQLKDGKVTEHWAVNDNLSFMMQLGAIPDPSKMAAGQKK
jgi:steroid delta-isomerase-like uncharacterized protein